MIVYLFSYLVAVPQKFCNIHFIIYCSNFTFKLQLGLEDIYTNIEYNRGNNGSIFG